MTHRDTVHLLHTCFQVHMQLVSVSIEGPVELQFYLEGLSSADDQLLPVIQVSVVLLSVLTRLRAQQVHRTHRQLVNLREKVSTLNLSMCLLHR